MFAAIAQLPVAAEWQVVLGEPDGPRARGLVTYGQATEPSSPWYLDQLLAWSTNSWRALPFTDTQIASDPRLSVTRLSYQR